MPGICLRISPFLSDCLHLLPCHRRLRSVAGLFSSLLISTLCIPSPLFFSFSLSSFFSFLFSLPEVSWLGVPDLMLLATLDRFGRSENVQSAVFSEDWFWLLFILELVEFVQICVLLVLGSLSSPKCQGAVSIEVMTGPYAWISWRVSRSVVPFCRLVVLS